MSHLKICLIQFIVSWLTEVPYWVHGPVAYKVNIDDSFHSC